MFHHYFRVRYAQLRAELDAYYARLYGLTRDELRYTPIGVDPKEIYGEDFSGESFRVLKERKIKQFGYLSWVADVDTVNS
jgi:hypothetical protein